jgi:hypothetical protein
LDNKKTGEKFVVKRDGDGHLTIARHPMDASKEWIEDMGKYEEYYEYRNIKIDFSL